MQNDRKIILEKWPKDTNHSLNEELLSRSLKFDQKLFFADDAELMNNGRIYYGVGVSHVSVRDFMEYQIYNKDLNGRYKGSSTPLRILKNNLDWSLLKKHSERSPVLVDKLVSAYSSFNGSTAAIFACSLFEDDVIDILREGKNSCYSAIREMLYFAKRNHMKDSSNDYIPCRYYAYKQAVGKHVLKEMKMRLGLV